MRYSIVTFGCRVNQADSLRIEEDFRRVGATAAPSELADVVVVNTCSVTATADQGARQTIRRIARQNPSSRIVVTGCYATRQPDEVAALANVARVVPNDRKLQTVDLITADLGLQTTVDRFGAGEGACGAIIEPGVGGRTVYFLRVQTGCDESCSYCIIPSTRGRARSLPLHDVLRQVEDAATAGFKEIALTGVHLGSYGRDLGHANGLLELLRALADRRGDVRFRISSLEPMDCTRDIVDLAADAPCLAPHFHLPLQHASDRVLRLMQRPYTIDLYKSLIDCIRQRLPHAAIGTDIVVGFPGETDEDFRALTDYMSTAAVTSLHVFAYSDRPGTVANAMGGKVHGAVIRDRAQEVRRMGARLSARFVASQIGSVRPALTLDDGTLALTDNYLKVRIPAGRDRNEWVAVRIDADGCGTPV